jgi:hypothetical protein
MKVSFFAASSLLLLGVSHAKVFASFSGSESKPQWSPYIYIANTVKDYECATADDKSKYNVGKTDCITTESLSNTVKISKITKEQRRLCLIKFTGNNCLSQSADEADREGSQQLVIRESAVAISS